MLEFIETKGDNRRRGIELERHGVTGLRRRSRECSKGSKTRKTKVSEVRERRGAAFTDEGTCGA